MLCKAVKLQELLLGLKIWEAKQHVECMDDAVKATLSLRPCVPLAVEVNLLRLEIVNLPHVIVVEEAIFKLGNTPFSVFECVLSPAASIVDIV